MPGQARKREAIHIIPGRSEESQGLVAKYCLIKLGQLVKTNPTTRDGAQVQAGMEVVSRDRTAAEWMGLDIPVRATAAAT